MTLQKICDLIKMLKTLTAAAAAVGTSKGYPAVTTVVTATSVRLKKSTWTCRVVVSDRRRQKRGVMKFLRSGNELVFFLHYLHEMGMSCRRQSAPSESHWDSRKKEEEDHEELTYAFTTNLSNIIAAVLDSLGFFRSQSFRSISKASQSVSVTRTRTLFHLDGNLFNSSLRDSFKCHTERNNFYTQSQLLIPKSMASNFLLETLINLLLKFLTQSSHSLP